MNVPLSSSPKRFFVFTLAAVLLSAAWLRAAGGAPDLHKVEVRDPAAARRLAAQGATVVADYGSYQLIETRAVDPRLTAGGQGQVRDEYNFILLNAGRLDTRKPEVKALRTPAANFNGKRLHLVHFVGPAQPAWRDQLAAAGVRIIAYIPYNAYLVYGDAKSLAQVRQLAATARHIQWDAPYVDDYKFHPAARAAAGKRKPGSPGPGLFAIQLVADQAANGHTVALLEQLKLDPIQRWHTTLDYVNLVVRLAPDSLNVVAAQPDVVSIHPYVTPRKFDERQDQIVAGNLTGDVPSGPGYLAWLAGKGFTQAQFTASGFAVDVSDSGIDNGTILPNHFGLYVDGAVTNASRVVYNRLEGSPNNPGSTISGCDGHGNLNAHIIGGHDDLPGFPFADGSGFHYGLGVCPFVKVGGSVIFDPNTFTSPNYNNLQSEAYQDGARVSGNSWGADVAGDYNFDSQNYDALVRDAQPTGSTFDTAGNQEMVIVFAAGNAGPGSGTVGSPGTAKNVFTIGAGENVQAFGGSDGSGISDSGADNASDVISFSSRGPCADGRHKPDILAPGTHVSGGVAQDIGPGPNGTADPCYDGSGVSGGVAPDIFFPSGQQFYTASSGTSHSTPCVAGACALLRQYFINNALPTPSPAMTKAYLMNSATYMTGVSANDTLWSESQGMGRLNLGAAFDGVPRTLRDQVPADLFTASGQLRVFTGVITDTNKPFRVTVAWTDAPGSTSGNAYANDLDLTVSAGGNTYKGNVFFGASSATGGSADPKNNVESVFVPAGVSGSFAVEVKGTGINFIGVPNDSNAFLQDFALVIYNGTNVPMAVVTPAGSTLTSETCFPTNNALDPGEVVTVDFVLANLGALDTTNLVATLEVSGGVTAPSGPQNYGALIAGGAAVSRPFTFTPTGACGGTVLAKLQLQDGAANLGFATFQFTLGKLVTVTAFTENFDSVTAPALPAGWTTSVSQSGFPWTTDTAASDTSPNAAFVPDVEPEGLSWLDSPVIPISSSGLQLVFRHFYDFEAFPSVGFDGGVLEISIGGGTFTDILAAGGSFVSGGYNRTISSLYGNPLAGRQAWSANSGGFITTTVTLPPAATGQNIQLRWMCGTDESLFETGWYLDSISIQESAYTCCTSLVVPIIVNPHLQETNIVFSVPTVNGQTYNVEYKNALTNGPWVLLNTFSGDGSLWTISNSVTAPQRFYRISSP